MTMRTHTCGALRPEDEGRKVRLCGWVDTLRDHGGVLFVDLRDRYGVTQIIFDPDEAPEAWKAAGAVRPEFVLQVEGQVALRPEEMINTQRSTGAIEVRGTSLRLLNTSRTLPFPLEERKATLVAEDLRLKYRYLDLRRASMQSHLRLRHKVMQAIRNYLSELDYTEVETPILSKSTPEGARDYLVPSRVHPGAFYALPQAPQQYKQLLMISGMDRYFQIARCFRDEDLRADRQPEFTQVDIEGSFIEPEDIYQMVDGLMACALEAAGFDRPELPLPRMTYAEAMDRYGCDKPDLRYGMPLTHLGDLFANSGFRVFRSVCDQGGVVKAINAKGLADLPIRVVDEWTATAQASGLNGLAYIRVQRDGTWKSPVAKFFSAEEKAALQERLDIEPGDLVLFAAGPAAVVNPLLGRLRVATADHFPVPLPADRFKLLWVTDFPLFEEEEGGGLQAMHHPFTAPHPEDQDRLESDPLQLRARAYDIVMNGIELGGGSIRIHDAELQERMLAKLGVPAEDIRERFGHLIEALRFGAPPHGGIALGFDRIVMLLAGAASLRDVIAFPKTQKATDLMMNAPSLVDARQLREVHLQGITS